MHRVVVMAAMLAVAVPVRAQIFQPGTQPVGHDGGIVDPIQTSSGCIRCHGGFDDARDHEPWDTWRGTMMASAGRDPIFRAALAIAEIDNPDAADFCVRCHSMPAWLTGRSSLAEWSEADGPRFLPDDDGSPSPDLDGVGCMVCHRSTDPMDPTMTGNAQLVFLDDADSEVRLGPYEYAIGEDPRHPTRQSDFLGQGRFCGQCHDIHNPVVDDAEGRPFAIESTFSEWANSAFADRNETCQDCHMPRIEGSALVADEGPLRETPRRHDLVGGSTWQLRAIAAAIPDSAGTIAPLFEASALRAEAMLRSAAALEITTAALAADRATVAVRVTNLSGHKLPTGYPEGRRMWIEVAVMDESGGVISGSGLYDSAEARIVDDAQLRTYEVKLGERGEPSFHFVLNDSVISDTRIPPEGFRASTERDIEPVGRDYADGAGGYRHYDEAAYDLLACGTGELSLRVRLLYQSTTREYAEFLRDNAPDSADPAIDNWGEIAFLAWRAHGGDVPVVMAEAIAALGSAQRACPPPDAGASLDPGPDTHDDGGCGCTAPGGRRGWPLSAPLLVGVAAVIAIHRRRGRRIGG